MEIAEEFRTIIHKIANLMPIPQIQSIYFPSLAPKAHIHKSEFMALRLEGNAIGLSFVLIPEFLQKEYMNLNPRDFIGSDPIPLALDFGSENPLINMIAMAAINAISQLFFQSIQYQFDFTTDSLGLLHITKKDTVGMVGFFGPLIPMIEKIHAKLIIIEKNENLVQQNPHWLVTLDPEQLTQCNKILITSSTLVNNTIEKILHHCSSASVKSIIGPTAGYIPDPLFARGIDVVGGTFVNNAEQFWNLLTENQNWGAATQKYCIQKSNYSIDQFLN